MSVKSRKAQVPPSKPWKDEAPEVTDAVVQYADKTAGKDCDLVHGGGGIF